MTPTRLFAIDAQAMKAILIRDYGGPEVLRLEDVASPMPGDGEVLIRVRAVTVNLARDRMIAAGAPSRRQALPLVPGLDPAGEVALVGGGVGVFKSGDRVVVFSRIACGQCRDCVRGDEADCANHRQIGIDRWGGYAEYIVAPATSVFPLPANLSFADAAAVMRHYPVALQLLFDKARLMPGQWVLVMGAAGALGSCGIRAAIAAGARVIAAAGADDRVDYALLLGAEAGINYRTGDLTAEVLRITDGVGVDVVYENVSDPETWPAAFAALRHGGTLVTAGGHGGGLVTLDADLLFRRHNRILGASGASRENVLATLHGAGAGKYRMEIADTIPLDRLHDAYTRLEGRDIRGKIVIDPALDGSR
jgi:NADPH:quinone reductase